jgi:hypothetical protein
LNTGEKFSKDKEPTPESKSGFAFVQEFCRSLRGRQEEGLFFSIHMWIGTTGARCSGALPGLAVGEHDLTLLCSFAGVGRAFGLAL